VTITALTVTGNYQMASGAAAAGQVEFTLTGDMQDAATKKIVAVSTVVVPLVNGAFSATLYANDDASTTPTGVAYQVVERITGTTATRSYQVVLPSASAGGTVDLSTLAPALPSNPVFNYLTVAAANAAYLTPAAASATFAPINDPRAGFTPFVNIPQTTIVGGQDDEAPTGNLATVATDTTNFDIGDRAWKVTVTGSTFPVSAELRLTYATPLTFPTATAAVCARVYIPDVAAITRITIDIYGDAGLVFADRWSRGSNAVDQKPLVVGWNTIRFPSFAATRTAGKWGNVYRVSVSGLAQSAGATFTIGRVWVESPRKAQILIIDDGPYQAFHLTAYPQLLARKLPVTLAIDPPYIGQLSGAPAKQRMTQAEIDAEIADGRSSGSIHLATNGGTTSSMTAAQIRADVMAGIKYCEQHSYTGGYFRAAWLGNSAPQALAAKDMMLASATYTTLAGATCWPPPDRYNISRWTLDNSRSTADIDTIMQGLKDTHGLLVFYVHGVSTPVVDSFDTTVENFNYWLTWVDDGLANGWLEGVTFETLWARSGGRFRTGLGGGMAAEYLDENGVITVQVLP
jgi:hypothetical protein